MYALSVYLAEVGLIIQHEEVSPVAWNLQVYCRVAVKAG